jgi:hypothetical protein
MNSNAMEMMIVPVVRGLFLVLMLGAAARGLVRMIGVIAASARHPEDSVAGAPPTALSSEMRAREEPDRRINDETLAAGIVA